MDNPLVLYLVQKDKWKTRKKMKEKNTIMRIDKFLSNQGIGSRRDVRKLIQKGNVYINGTLINKIDVKIDATIDDIECNGQKVTYQSGVYLMLNKPKNCITATEDKHHKVVMDYIEHPQRRHLFPVGRLDKDTTGLLIITDDGQLAHDLLAPKKHVNKTYHAKLDKEITQSIIDAFYAGIELDDGYKTQPATLKKIEDTEQPYDVEVVIQEGKYHQIKRMFSACECEVLELKRVQMGSVKLDAQLAEGEYRELTQEEILQLRERK